MHVGPWSCTGMCLPPLPHLPLSLLFYTQYCPRLTLQLANLQDYELNFSSQGQEPVEEEALASMCPNRAMPE